MARKYSDELSERATWMAVELRKDPAIHVGVVGRVAEQLGRVSRRWTRKGWPGWSRRTGSSREPTRSCERRQLFLGSGARPQTEVIVAYIDEHRHRVVDDKPLGVEPIIEVLATAGVEIAPSTYYAAKTRPPSARAVRDASLVPVIAKVHRENLGV